jgi:hypothetical protein
VYGTLTGAPVSHVSWPHVAFIHVHAATCGNMLDSCIWALAADAHVPACLPAWLATDGLELMTDSKVQTHTKTCLSVCLLHWVTGCIQGL